MKRRASVSIQEADIFNIMKDYANFLSSSPIQMFNLKPNDEGIVKVKMRDLANYT